MFAYGYGVCLTFTLGLIERREKVDLGARTLDYTVDLCKDDLIFKVCAMLSLDAPDLDKDKARELIEKPIAITLTRRRPVETSK